MPLSKKVVFFGKLFAYIALACFVAFFAWSVSSSVASNAAAATSSSMASSSMTSADVASAANKAKSDLGSAIVLNVIAFLVFAGFALLYALLGKKTPRWLFALSDTLGMAGSFVIVAAFAAIMALVVALTAPICAVMSTSAASSAMTSASSSASGTCIDAGTIFYDAPIFALYASFALMPSAISSWVSVWVHQKWQGITQIVCSGLAILACFICGIYILCLAMSLGFLYVGGAFLIGSALSYRLEDIQIA